VSERVPFNCNEVLALTKTILSPIGRVWMGHFGGQICNFGAPNSRFTNAKFKCHKKSALQEIHFEYKNVTTACSEA